MEGRLARIGLRVWVAGVLLFLFVPIAIICLYAFNSSNVQSWPIHGLSTKWFTVAWHDPQVRAAFVLSLKAGLFATAVALLLGSAAAFGVHRFRFFGREAVSLLLVLPLALPGIITGIALNSAFHFAGIGLSLYTIIIGHATFCIVVVYNNMLARLRRVSGSGWWRPRWPCCSAPPWRTRCTSSGSSAARPSRSCWCCRSRCPASSPVSR